jgi:glycosyltransferase involved in cell wall biosynthesis
MGGAQGGASFVVPWYGEGIPGGAEAEARRTAQNLAAAGTPVSVFTTTLQGLGSDWDHEMLPAGESWEQGVRVVRFAPSARDGVAFGSLNARVVAGESLTPREEDRFFRNFVHSRELFAHLAANPQEGPFFFIPYLFTTSVWGPTVHPSKSVIVPCLHDEGYARLGSVRRAFETARAVVFHVPAERDLAASLYDLGRTEPLVLGEGVDADWSADPERFRSKYGLRQPFVLYAGRKDAGKNVPLLAKYFARYLQDHPERKGLKLVMIGNLPAPVPPGAEDDIVDLGFVSKQDKYDAYAAAGVLVQPSLMESFSLVIMESWLAGTPVMVHAGCPVTAEHARTSGGGLAFADYPRFAEGLGMLLERGELREQMGRAGRRYVLENFSWPVVVERYQKLIQRLHAEPVPEPVELPRRMDAPAPGPGGSRTRAGQRPRTCKRRGRGPAVHQLVADFAYGDAIGNDILAIQKALIARGYESEIFAEQVHPNLVSRAVPAAEAGEALAPDDVVLFHFSIGHSLADQVPRLPGRKVLRYHNITPAHFLEDVYPAAALRSRQGRRQLSRLAPAVELGIGVSDFNSDELAACGCPNTITVPILLDLEQLGAAPDAELLRELRGQGPNVLHVGRVAPNKRIEDLVKVQYWLAKLVPGARLLIVGGGDDNAYGRGVRRLADKLEAPGVHFSGHVSDAELAAYYRSADLYLCQSEHEGFCVPLVESMHFGVPVVAFASTGIPGTLGDGGVLLPAKDHVLTAEVCARILADDGLRRALAERARSRLARFQPDEVADELCRALVRQLGLEDG